MGTKYFVARGREVVRVPDQFDLRRLESHGNRSGLVLDMPFDGRSDPELVESIGEHDMSLDEATAMLKRYFTRRVVGSRRLGNVISTQVARGGAP